jgi:predicted heme/steroid binding protein
MKKLIGTVRQTIKRYPLVTFAVILGTAMVLSSLAFAGKVKRTNSGSFDTASVLPQSVTPPAGATQKFNADTIKQYDGKDGHKCYVAVDGIVYEIAGKGLWQDGQHTPSDGQAYCGADLSQAITKSPHGKSKLEELPKVGTYQ